MPAAMANSGDATAIAQNIASKVGGPQGPGSAHGHHGGHHKSAASGTAPATRSNSPSSPLLDELSSLLNTDPAV